MAQVTKKTKKDGTTSYLIRAYSGRTQAGKVITKCKTVTPPGRADSTENGTLGAGAGRPV